MKKYIPMVNRVCSIIFVIFFLFFLISMKKGDNKKMDNEKIEIMHEGCELDVKLNLESKQDLSFNIVAINNLGFDIALPMYCINIYDTNGDVLTNTYIDLLNESGNSPIYTGILAKIVIGSAKLSNCYILKKGESVVIQIPTLKNSFDFDNFDYSELHIKYKGFLGESNEIIIKK